MKKKHTNALIHESSPYLLQHAHNPVAWEAWGPEVLEKASRENKLLLVSIGYAACHWCHVMEKECFEDEEVAGVMNRHFIPVKVDREERPDVDHIYMDALQLMTGGGGWPLNVVALPDGRPFWGATYVKKDDWIQVLGQLAQLYRTDPGKVVGYAQNLADGIRSINLIRPREVQPLITKKQLSETISEWSGYFDTYLGGYKRAPKFMMPVTLNFLLHYAHSQNDADLLDYVNTTLTKMAYGGIYDHLGGGFSRYAVDVKWHVPHFEKMLYDNAQLISLYAKAYAATGNTLYQKVVRQSLAFVQRELMAPDGGFYASLDADSLNEDGVLEEGAYYVWGKEALQQRLGPHFALFADYYNINSYGHWEEGKYVLIRDASAAEVAEKHGIAVETLEERLESCRELLAGVRDKRNRPRLDNKVLASWNGWMLQALVDAARYLEDQNYRELALSHAAFIKAQLIAGDGKVYHNQAPEKNRIAGYLEDYASIVQAFLGLYQLTFEEAWLQEARKLTDYCLKYFLDPDSRMFFFTSREDPYVVRRTLETSDNVIPASNSVMAKNLFLLSRYFPEGPYGGQSRQMLVNMQENMESHAQSHANWLQLLLYHLDPFFELALSGPEAGRLAKEFYPRYLPHIAMAAGTAESSLPLLQGRYKSGQTLLYVCSEGRCQLPVTTVEAALDQLIAR